MADTRLIDANAVEKEFESCLNLLCENPITRNTYEMSLNKQVCNAALRILRNAQTIEPESLRQKSKWVYMGRAGVPRSTYRCDKCGMNIDEYWFYPIGSQICTPFKYCPYCGSKMEWL